jgi:hypothetical protein
VRQGFHPQLYAERGVPGGVRLTPAAGPEQVVVPDQEVAVGVDAETDLQPIQLEGDVS